MSESWDTQLKKIKADMESVKIDILQREEIFEKNKREFLENVVLPAYDKFIESFIKVFTEYKSSLHIDKNAEKPKLYAGDKNNPEWDFWLSFNLSSNSQTSVSYSFEFNNRLVVDQHPFVTDFDGSWTNAINKDLIIQTIIDNLRQKLTQKDSGIVFTID